jgi:DNA-directed RNA polymerase subunit RPC12/RpoP
MIGSTTCATCHQLLELAYNTPHNIPYVCKACWALIDVVIVDTYMTAFDDSRITRIRQFLCPQCYQAHP